jgi:hypothetical protein
MLLEHGKGTAMLLVNFKCVKTHFQYSTGFLNLICTVQYATKTTIELRTQAVKFLMLLNPCQKKIRKLRFPGVKIATNYRVRAIHCLLFPIIFWVADNFFGL